MKQNGILLFLLISISCSGQCTYFSSHTETYKSRIIHNIYFTDISFNPEFSTQAIPSEFHLNNFENNEQWEAIENPNRPKPPVLTTAASNLEVCEGNTSTLTATSEYPIEWYTSYPPEGEPVARGNVFITPPLSQGYYIFHAIANHNGLKSNSSEMEVIMVYPLPFINMVHSSESICAGESATLSAFGTRYYSWNTGESGNEIVIHPNQTTTYRVTGMNTAGCKSTQDFIQHVDVCEPLDASNHSNEQGKDQSLSFESHLSHLIYPNPNSGEFNIRIDNPSEHTSIEVYNSFGDMIYSSIIQTNVTEVKLPNAPKGIYTLRVLEHNALVKQEKVVIEN